MSLSHGPIWFLNICEMCLFIRQDEKEIIKRFIYSEWAPCLKSFRVCGILWNGLDKLLHKMQCVFDTIAFISVHTFLFNTLPEKIWFAVGSYDKRYYSLDGNEELSTTNKLKWLVLYYRAERRSLTSQVFYFTSQLFSSTKPCCYSSLSLSLKNIGNMFTLIIHLRFY